jgi:hypothetical protein
MNIDIRIPIGLMFTVLGLILTVFGLITNFGSIAQETYKPSLGINLNLWWGLINLAFGLAMLGLAWRATQKEKQKP